MWATSGGTNWPGAGAIPETHTVYAQAAKAFVAASSLRAEHADRSPGHEICVGVEGTGSAALGPGFGSAAMPRLAAARPRRPAAPATPRGWPTRRRRRQGAAVGT
jgi:hypothetical protein